MTARKTAITLGSAACLAVACASVKGYEGYAPTVKPDRLAAGLPTGGYGETEGVRLGETHNEKYWSDRLQKRLAEEYDAGIGKCIHVELPDGVRAMAISASYNAGVTAVCHSPMVAKWNAGDIRGGCKAIYTEVIRKGVAIPTGWRIGSHPRKGGPLVIQRGLVNRRKSERAKCIAAIDAPRPAATEPVPDPVGVPLPPVVASPIDPVPAVVAAKPLGFWSHVRCFVFKCGGPA